MTDPISNERLAPCPFCGDKAFASETLDGGHYVMCRAEDCWAMTGYLPTKADAIAAWNRRQSPAGVEKSDHVPHVRNMVELHIVFQDDGGPANLRFVEVENIDGESVAAGTWIDRPDGLRALALTVHRSELRNILDGSPSLSVKEPEGVGHLCGYAEIQTYTGAVTLVAPPHMARPQGICVDVCLALEVTKLWDAGITTTGCCCGHGSHPAYIGVIDADIPRMKALGYQVHHNPTRPGDEDSFVPKTDLASPQPNPVTISDDDLASDDRWNAGVNYAVERLCEIFGIDPKTINWDAATETLDGDVMSVLCNVLVAAYGEEWSSSEQDTAAIRTALTAALSSKGEE